MRDARCSLGQGMSRMVTMTSSALRVAETASLGRSHLSYPYMSVSLIVGLQGADRI